MSSGNYYLIMKNRRAFIVGIKTTSLTKKEKFFFKKYKPWGVILFSRNLKNLYQIKKLTNDIRYIFRDKNYPILIDQEGGKVNRLNKLIEASTLSAEFFGNLYKSNKKKFYNYYTVYIAQISYLLNEIGININTVPVLDVRKAKSNNIIGNRSFSLVPKNVSNIGDFCIKKFNKEKIGTVIKHIPGHGLANVDSHKKTPIVKKKQNIYTKTILCHLKINKLFLL